MKKNCPFCKKELTALSDTYLICNTKGCVMQASILGSDQWEAIDRKNALVIVSIAGGKIKDIHSYDGMDKPKYVLIDYDDETCPVCHSKEYDKTSVSPCRACGYDEAEDNALACAVNLLVGRKCPTCGIQGNLTDRCAYCGQPIESEDKNV